MKAGACGAIGLSDLAVRAAKFIDPNVVEIQISPNEARLISK